MVAVVKQQHVRSPLNWIGGKYYSAKRIVAVFPHADTYDAYVEVFGGAAHVMFAKVPHKHLEVYNDLNGDLVNFWLQARDNHAEMQSRLESLPYSRELYERYQASLYSGEYLDSVERATRWFYVLRSSVGGIMRKSTGNWGYCLSNIKLTNRAHAYRSATSLLSSVSERFHCVQIDNRGYEKVLATYRLPRTLFYCDPPYIDAEFYYGDTPPFTLDDHRRLAELLNATSAMVALSYYEHPILNELYPSSKWQRMTWQTNKHAERTSGTRQKGQEVLLTNYIPSQLSLVEAA